MTRRHFPKIAAHGGPAPAWLVEHTERNRHVIGPSSELVAEWEAAGLRLPDIPAMRRYRIARVRAHLVANDLDAVLLHDPLNVKYATDTTNMPIWTMHNEVRYCFVAADGPAIVFEFSHGEFLSAHSEVVDEIRPGTSFLPFYAGSRAEEVAGRFADEIVELVRDHQRAGGRLGIDTLGLEGIRAIEARGVEVVPAMQVMENARTVKSADEILAMRCAIHACERNIHDMRAIFVPGVTEVELWAELQKANLLRYGEWMETRILASGDRSNPWYQEASTKPVRAGELMAFDTDMVGAYGMCVDMSRTWLCGDATPSATQADVHSRAREMIERNIPLFTAGSTYREITEKLRYPSVEEFNGYTVLAHGTGLCDEFPSFFTREQWDVCGFDGMIETGMVLSIESFVGAKSGGEGVKLEEMIVVTDDGPELLTSYSMDLV
jgi:Xaa-Pro aminopeptidase